MFEELLPGSVAVVVETLGSDALGDGVILYPEEEAVIARAVEKRHREFTAVRGCARLAMENSDGRSVQCRPPSRVTFRTSPTPPVRAADRVRQDSEPTALLSWRVER